MLPTIVSNRLIQARRYSEEWKLEIDKCTKFTVRLEIHELPDAAQRSLLDLIEEEAVYDSLEDALDKIWSCILRIREEAPGSMDGDYIEVTDDRLVTWVALWPSVRVVFLVDIAE